MSVTRKRESMVVSRRTLWSPACTGRTILLNADPGLPAGIRPSGRRRRSHLLRIAGLHHRAHPVEQRVGVAAAQGRDFGLGALGDADLALARRDRIQNLRRRVVGGPAVVARLVARSADAAGALHSVAAGGGHPTPR